MAFLSAPAGKLYFMKPAEAFFIYFKVMLTAGAIITAPVSFLRILGLFGSPPFTTHEKAAALLPGTDVADPLPVGHRFSWFIVLPRGLQFFLNFSSDSVQPLLSMESYLNFVFMLVLPFGLIFNLPWCSSSWQNSASSHRACWPKSESTSFSCPSSLQRSSRRRRTSYPSASWPCR